MSTYPTYRYDMSKHLKKIDMSFRRDKPYNELPSLPACCGAGDTPCSEGVHRSQSRCCEFSESFPETLRDRALKTTPRCGRGGTVRRTILGFLKFTLSAPDRFESVSAEE